MKKSIRILALLFLLLLLISGVGYSVFTTHGKIAGMQFTTGHVDLALLSDLTQPATPGNLTKSLDGAVFEGLMHNSQRQLPFKITNIGTLPLQTVLNMQSYDPETTLDLKDAISVSLYRWFDDGDGLVDEAELGQPLETRTMHDWVSTPFALGSLAPATVLGFVLKFTVSDLDNAYQGMSTTVDFIFDAAASNN